MEPNLSQALHLINGDTVSKRIQQGGVVNKMIQNKLTNEQIVENLYQRCLGRKPTEKEKQKLAPHLAAIDEKKVKRKDVLEDIFWAILNTREFVFTH